MLKRIVAGIVILVSLALMPSLPSDTLRRTEQAEDIDSRYQMEPFADPDGSIFVPGLGSAVGQRQPVGVRFLTLPFTDPRIVVQQGWIYNWGSVHSGIDYTLTDPQTKRLRSFDVVAAADGWACGNCSGRQGNAVFIKHVLEGRVFYTYYGHLASIEAGIPQGNQRQTTWVTRGQKLGMAGSTGADTVHLHFQLNTPSGPVDPYDLWTTREPYSPGCRECRTGGAPLWTADPPAYHTLTEGLAPAATPTLMPVPTPTLMPAPTPTKEVTCKLEWEGIVEGAVTGERPEREWCLTAAGGEWVSISMFGTGGNSTLDTYLKVYAPDGRLIASDDDGAQVGSNSFLVARLEGSGTYRVVATRFGSTGSTGAYRLRVERGAKSALGDLNRDCRVDRADFDLMDAALKTNDLKADLNLDGVLDAQDQTIQIYRLGRGCMALPGPQN